MAAIEAPDKVTDINSVRLFPIPAEIKESFAISDDIADVARDLIERYPKRFGHIAAEEVEYMWKRKGGRSGRRDRLYGVAIPTGDSLLMFYARKGIILWLAYDHVKSRAMNALQVEAQVFHALMDIGKNAKGSPILQTPEARVYPEELQIYGYWSTPLAKIENIQMGLPLTDDEPAEGTNEPE